MAIVVRALTATTDAEIVDCLKWLVESSAGTGLLHESFMYNDVTNFTRSWFAVSLRGIFLFLTIASVQWVNSFFGEAILSLLKTHPHLLT